MFIKLVIRYLHILCCTIILSICGNKLHAQLNYTFERINSENGLPANTIKGLQFDEKTRFLWVATESGIVRYNGHSFQNFGVSPYTKKLNGRVNFFEKAIDGTLFGKLIDESIFKVQLNKAVIDSTASRIKNEDDYLEYKYHLPKKHHSINSNDDINYFDYKLNGSIYYILNNKLKQIKNGKCDTLATFKNGEQGFLIQNKFFLIQSNGNILEVINRKTFELNYLTHLKIPNFKKGYRFKIFQNNSLDEVYILFGNFLFKLQFYNNKFSLLLITDQIPKLEHITYLQIDKITQTLYLGSDNRGLIVGRLLYFDHLMPNGNINGTSTSAYAQIELDNGNTQINSGQIFGSNSKKASIVFNKSTNNNTLTSSNNIVYFTNSDGLNEYDLDKHLILNIFKKSYLLNGPFLEINKEIYLFNKSGIVKKRLNGSWELILKFKSVPLNFVIYQVSKLKNNEILLATSDGLYKYNISNNSFKLYFRDSEKSNFRSILDIGGYYLLGTYGSGAYMYKDDTLKKIPSDQDGFLNFLHCFIIDPKNRIWASTNNGIFMTNKSSIIDFWNLDYTDILYKYFGKTEGIEMLEMNGGCSPCAIKLKNGNISIPGIDGLLQFDPNKIVDLKIVPYVFLDKISINDNNFENNNISDLSYKTNKILFQLGISGMLSKENIILEYKLDESEFWNQLPIKDPNLNIVNPGFGLHKVKVRLRSTYNSKWEFKQFDFYINYPWYFNPYMYFVYFTIFVLIVLLYIRFKTIFYLRRQKLLEEEVYSKTKSLNNINQYLLKRNKAKDYVIAIMNHDILTPLKYLHITAKSIAEISHEEKVKYSLVQIAKTSKELEYLTSNLLNWVKFDNIVRLPNKQPVYLNQLVNNLIDFVSPFNQNSQVVILNKVNDDVIFDSWPDPLRILLYNLIINALKSTYKGSIIIDYKLSLDGHTILISDTGIGMTSKMIQYLLTGKIADEIENIPHFKKGNGVGYQIIRNILNLMKSSIKIESTEKLGTTVLIWLPI